MARYPVFEDYQQNGHYSEGIKKCDELLRRSHDDIPLLVTKLQLSIASKVDHTQVLEQLLEAQPRDLSQILAIEQALLHAQQDVFPAPLTIGALAGKFWDNAVKLSSNSSDKFDVLSLRFSQAVLDSRHIDAQHTLVQLKILQPKSRVFYMAHAAYTQLTSTSESDFQSRLAITLARKAVADRFDEDRRLDCRVPGQIFAIQQSQADLDSIKERPFQESRQAYQALRLGNVNINNDTHATLPPRQSSGVTHTETIDDLKMRVRPVLESHETSTETLLLLFSEAVRLFDDILGNYTPQLTRSLSDSCFLSMSILIKLYTTSDSSAYLLQAARLCEALLQACPDVHEARMVLIYIYTRLNLGTLAIRQFDALKIKEIQLDTVGHSLFLGLSHMLPWPTSLNGKEVFDSFKRTANALNFYVRYEDRLADTIADVLNHGQTGMIFDTQRLRDDLKWSTTKRFTLLEHRCVARLLGKDVVDVAEASCLGPRVLENWLTQRDNRDFGATFNHGVNVEVALHGEAATNVEPTLLRGLALDTVWSISNNKQALLLNPKTLLDKLEDSLTTTPPLEEATPVVKIVDKLTILMLRSALSSDRCMPENLDNLLSTLSEIPRHVLQQTGTVFCSSLRETYRYMDALRCIMAHCSMLRRANRPEILQFLKQIEALVQTQHADNVSFATQQRRHCRSRVQDALSEAKDAWDVQHHATAIAPHGFIEAIATSAEEGWHGAMRIRLS